MAKRDPSQNPSKALKSLGARPRKNLGQHFLTSQSVLDRIIDGAEITPGQGIVEVGPGLGALTVRLLSAGAHVLALEMDRDLGPALEARLGADAPFTLMMGDALELDIAPHLKAELAPWKVVANLPYNVATPIIFRFLEMSPGFERLVVMVQKEVADRMLASPGEKAFGAMTLNLGYLAQVKRVVNVPPGAFHPPPKVHSTVVCITPHGAPPVDPGDPKLLKRIIKLSFQGRRKTLMNGLKPLGLPREDLEAVLTGADIPVSVRGERLSLAQFAAIARGIHALKT